MIGRYDICEVLPVVASLSSSSAPSAYSSEVIAPSDQFSSASAPDAATSEDSAAREVTGDESGSVGVIDSLQKTAEF